MTKALSLELSISNSGIDFLHIELDLDKMLTNYLGTSIKNSTRIEESFLRRSIWKIMRN